NEDPMLRGLGGVGIDSGLSISFGDVVIEAGARLGGMLADIAGDIWGWIKAQLFGVAATGDPMLAGLGGIGIGTGAEPISIGDVLIEGTIVLAGELSDLGGDVERALGLDSSHAEIEQARMSGQDAGKKLAE